MFDPDHGQPCRMLRACRRKGVIDPMLRVLVLLCYFAVVLTPLGAAQADTACTMIGAAQPHSAQDHSANGTNQKHGANQKSPAQGHPVQTCKQVCVVAAILTADVPVSAQAVYDVPPPRPALRIHASHLPDPSERPPKAPV